MSAPSNYTAGSTPASDAPRDRSWRDAAYAAGTTPMAVWLVLRDDIPLGKPSLIDLRYLDDPDFAAYVDATIADLAPADDRSEDR